MKSVMNKTRITEKRYSDKVKIDKKENILNNKKHKKQNKNK